MIAAPPFAYPLPPSPPLARLRCLVGQGLRVARRWGQVFEALAAVVDGSDQYTLVYSDLVEAISLIESLEPVSRRIEYVE